MSFMMQIDAARVATQLDLIAAEYARRKAFGASLEFCCRIACLLEDDETIARRLRVAVTTVRNWREIGRR